MEKRIYPRAIETIGRPEPIARTSISKEEEAGSALQTLYDRKTTFLR